MNGLAAGIGDFGIPRFSANGKLLAACGGGCGILCEDTHKCPDCNAHMHPFCGFDAGVGEGHGHGRLCNTCKVKRMTNGRRRLPLVPPPPPPPPSPPLPRPNRRTVATELNLPELAEAPAEQVTRPHPQYQSAFIGFMDHTFGRKFKKNATFNPVEIRRLIKPHHVIDYLHMLTYEKVDDVNYKVDNPKRRSNGILHIKSAISHYMPDDFPWNGASGNPTRSKPVNKLIEAIRQAEREKRGKKSQARRELHEVEFRKTIELLQSTFSFIKSCLIVCMLVLQLHIVARGSDVSQLFMNQIKPHSKHDFALELTVEWSKNVKDERDCPPQILLGAMDTQYCTHLALAIYLEEAIARGRACSGFDKAYLFTDDFDPSPPEGRNWEPEELEKNRKNSPTKKLCSRYRTCLKSIFESEVFLAISSTIGGLIGSHSIRKYAATLAKRFGVSMRDVDGRGRWKGDTATKHKVAAGHYVSPDQPFIDANVARVLCLDNPVAYRVHGQATNVTDNWLKEYVQPPAMPQQQQQQAAPPSQWLEDMVMRIHQNQQSHLQQLNMFQQNMTNLFQNQRQYMDGRFDRVDRNLATIQVQPPRMASPGRRAQNFASLGLVERRDNHGRRRRERLTTATDDRPAKITKNLKTVGDIWQEWSTGINGCKPVKDWIPAEQSLPGNNTYYRRKGLYFMLNDLVANRLNAGAAISLVEKLYPRAKILEISRDLKKRREKTTSNRS
ncbi:unknown protein [Seminavis robusta]|uniref:Uncharacterized protein n=1 Tax=Seminavis robusta TaxID=568900 RepID=A0A9N8EI84_9STRA|nr:unknown protein [Seminavis robusta]|eukprot:Sro996_g229220.1 n/a (725) ;mRNA; r:641-3085